MHLLAVSLVAPGLAALAVRPRGSGPARSWRSRTAVTMRDVNPCPEIFCNRAINMENIRAVGFDMDYTLAIYRQKEMDKLSVRAIVDKLVKRGYPEWIRDVDYPIDFPIRGVLIDKKLGKHKAK